jgi:hypothetical protein
MSPRTSLLVSVLALCLQSACGPAPEVCADGQEPTPQPLRPRGEAGLHPYAHAHNDYEHARPLEDALDARFYSVEADVWFADGRFEVSHNGWGAKGTLEALYLAPLQARVDSQGSVHGDGLPFTLWVDLKDSNARLVEDLRALFQGFSMLQPTGGAAVSSPVRIALTGNAEMKEAFANGNNGPEALPAVTRDSNDFSLDDPVATDELWRAYALNWGRYISWNGAGEPPADQRRRLHCLVENAHAKGRVLRLFSAPDREEVWAASIEAGVDFLHTDRLEALSDFLASQP